MAGGHSTGARGHSDRSCRARPAQGDRTHACNACTEGRHEDVDRELRTDDVGAQAHWLPRPGERAMSDAAQLTIVQLYPEELGVAGDRGNVMAISARLERAGLAARVVEYRRGDDFPADADFVVIGSGPLSAMRNIYDDLTGRASVLSQLAEARTPI